MLLWLVKAYTMLTSRRWQFFVSTLLAGLIGLAAAAPPDSFRFVILGDRTGEAQPGVYERVWQQAAAETPAFVLSIGDTIQGLNDETAESEWRHVQQILAPFRRIPLYLAAGNHDIWSEHSERLFQKYAKHAPHYSFDYEQAHFTILDNSRTEEFSSDELTFLERDLQAHAAQPLKFIVSHRPSWLIAVMLGNPQFPLHQAAKKYGVQSVIAGHVHQMLHVDLEGVTYLSMASSGGHLRASKKYEDGWFFGLTVVDVRGKEVNFQIKELAPPYGRARVTRPKDWGNAGLVHPN
jgi:3',5'-cyclic-AMP phosphodiesterase